MDIDLKKKKPKTGHKNSRVSTTKSAKALTKSQSGRGTQVPGTKMLYNGTMH